MMEKNHGLSIENVVATATLGHGIDLRGIMKIHANVEYRPKRFPGLVFRLKRPRTSTLIFRSGKMVCTGATSEKQARRAIRKIVRMLKNGGMVILSRPEVKIVNMVATGYLGGRIDLEMAADLLENVMYEPEMFPGLILRMSNPKAVLLLYSTGKFVCTGAKNERQVHRAVDKISGILEDEGLIYVTMTSLEPMEGIRTSL